MKNNMDIRRMVLAAGCTYKMIAQQMGITPEHLSRQLRYELRPEMRERIIDAVRAIEAEADEAAGDRR